MSSLASRERLDVLDGLRGLAILLVVWYHAWLVSGQSIAALNFLAEAGFLGVDLFFFISGFCLFYPYARASRDGRETPTTRRFFVRRAVKILPSYLIALTVLAVVYHGRFASPAEAAVQLATHLTFTHPLLPLTFGAISGPLWTIGVEVEFYLLFPFVCRFFRKAPVAGYIALIAVSQTYRFVLGHAGLTSSFLLINQLPAYLDVFGSGMFAAFALTRMHGRVSDRWRPVATLVSAGAFMLGIAALVEVSEIGRTADMNAAYDWVNAVRVAFGPLCALLALSTSFALPVWRSAVAMRALVFLSMISYNLYLWNLEIIVWYHQAGFASVPTFVFGIATAVLLATAITYAIERPILESDPAQLWRIACERLGLRRRGSDSASDARTAAPT